MIFNQDCTETKLKFQHSNRHSNAQYTKNERTFERRYRCVCCDWEKNETNIYSEWGERLQWS